MNKFKIFYTFLWLLALIAYSIPWAEIETYSGVKTFDGWSFTVPFSFTYVIGLALGLLVILANWKPALSSVLAGILMLIGVIGGESGYALAEGVCALEGGRAVVLSGMGLAFIVSIVYIVLGGYIGKKLEESVERT